MGAVTRCAALSIVLVAAPAQAETVADWRPFVTEAAQRFGVPVAWIEQVMQAESAGRSTLNGRAIISRAGAMGLMQLMPATWTDMRRQLGLGANPFDPRDNILAGTCYLRLMYDRFGYPGLFAAYNAGPGRYQDYLAGRARLPNETIAYLQSVTGRSRTDRPPAPDVPKPGLFVALATLAPPAPQETKPAAADGLFAVRHLP
ncbi:lytic transglycosylase domain-containing protein [Sphingomonas immobilis]|uniref:Lytic transglycosylase domain-containing protein n=1 Tax=Sphingomonas immobilis TaxID=3063997 RepID=A0ABT9A161_9SPHN|nr:lytic transglycosylase domain-containing protein [Sphingomonas sp. CA1-15]MDO7843570.1 lytic transglycosylase domain-containing protein [Sphingomonas sp. CA1-15]